MADETKEPKAGKASKLYVVAHGRVQLDDTPEGTRKVGDTVKASEVGGDGNALKLVADGFLRAKE